MFTIEALLEAIDAGFKRAAVDTLDALKDDAKVIAASQAAYDMLPLAVRIGLKYSIGRDGFDRYVLRLRDHMLAEETTSLAALARDRVAELSLTAPAKIQALLATFIDPRAVLEASSPGPARSPEPVAALSPAKAEAARMWFLLRRDEQIGPLSDTEFLGIAEAGHLQTTDMIWREGLETWLPLTALPALAKQQALPGA